MTTPVRSKARYEIAPDRGPHGDHVSHGWYVVDMRTQREPDWYGVNVDSVAGPFGHAGQAFDVAERMNRPWWKRLLTHLKGKSAQ